jgi:hypothetical protein
MPTGLSTCRLTGPPRFAACASVCVLRVQYVQAASRTLQAFALDEPMTLAVTDFISDTVSSRGELLRCIAFTYTSPPFLARLCPSHSHHSVCVHRSHLAGWKPAVKEELPRLTRALLSGMRHSLDNLQEVARVLCCFTFYDVPSSRAACVERLPVFGSLRCLRLARSHGLTARRCSVKCRKSGAY